MCAGCKKQFAEVLARCYFSFATIQQPKGDPTKYQTNIDQQTYIEKKLKINLVLKNDLIDLQHRKISLIEEKEAYRKKNKKVQLSIITLSREILNRQQAAINSIADNAKITEKFAQLQVLNDCARYGNISE